MKAQRRWSFLAGTALRLCLGIAFLASLIHPATREVQVLCARLLFRFLPLGGNICIWQQNEYEWIIEIPTPRFTESFHEQARANAGRSADDLLLALSVGGYADFTFEPPLPDDLEGHPLFPLAAMAYAGTATSRADYWRDYPARQPPEGKVIDLLRLAQRTHPDNGALWLAEGALHLKAGREDAGLDALRIAAEKGAGTPRRMPRSSASCASSRPRGCPRSKPLSRHMAPACSTSPA